ncbi:MAG: FAD-dependent oxidoreductase [Methyloprofundus sp.]|nr:FAD-dependent oxidoreductase [Methyloprofundus sp.]
MHSIPDITFVGGGVTGLLSARLFSMAGANVTIVDKNRIGQESSWAGGGILLPLYPWRQAEAISQLVMPSIAAYPELAQELIESTGLDPEYIISGLLMTQLADLDKAQDWCHRYSVESCPVTAEQLQYFPQIDDQSLYLPGIAQARNPRLLKSLKQDLIQRGVKVIENCDIEEISLKHNHVTAIASKSEVLAVNQLVISAGAWTANLWAQLLGNYTATTQPEIFPVKGQMIIFDAPVNTLDTMVLENDRYLIPRQDGKILCGSTVESADFDKTTSERARQSLAAFARQLFPALESAPITHHWAGLRPGTQQGIPYIDNHPEINNLAISAGHFRNGFAMGPASAQLLYEIITNQASALDSAPYRLSAKH